MSIPFRLNLPIQILDKAGRKSITRKRMWLTVSTWSIKSMKQILIVFIKLLKDPICFYYISTRVELSDLNINIFAFCSPVALIFPVHHRNNRISTSNVWEKNVYWRQACKFENKYNCYEHQQKVMRNILETRLITSLSLLYENTYH